MSAEELNRALEMIAGRGSRDQPAVTLEDLIEWQVSRGTDPDLASKLILRYIELQPELRFRGQIEGVLEREFASHPAMPGTANDRLRTVTRTGAAVRFLGLPDIDAQLPPEQFKVNLRAWRDSWIGQISQAIKAVRDTCDLSKAIGHLMLSERMFVTDRPLTFNAAQRALLSEEAVEFVEASRKGIAAVVKVQEECAKQVKPVKKKRAPAKPTKSNT